MLRGHVLGEDTVRVCRRPEKGKVAVTDRSPWMWLTDGSPIGPDCAAPVKTESGVQAPKPTLLGKKRRSCSEAPSSTRQSVSQPRRTAPAADSEAEGSGAGCSLHTKCSRTLQSNNRSLSLSAEVDSDEAQTGEGVSVGATRKLGDPPRNRLETKPLGCSEVPPLPKARLLRAAEWPSLPLKQKTASQQPGLTRRLISKNEGHPARRGHKHPLHRTPARKWLPKKSVQIPSSRSQLKRAWTPERKRGPRHVGSEAISLVRHSQTAFSPSRLQLFHCVSDPAVMVSHLLLRANVSIEHRYR